MDTVVADTPSDHVDDVARHGGLDVRGASIGKDARHDTDGSAIDQGLADVTIVKHDGSVDRWNTGFISAHANAGVDTSKNARRMEQVVGQITFPIWGTKTKDIGVGNGSGPQSRSQDVAVHAHDTGHGAPVRVQR